MLYALIENGIVVNIIWLNARNASDFPGCVAFDGYPVSIGDEYHDGKFWRNGEELLDEQGQLNERLTSENKSLKAQIKAISDRNDFIEDCIAEMATVVYADETTTNTPT